jgi:hypothetical protein
MQSCCVGQIISGFIKAGLIAGISALIGYLLIGLGSNFLLLMLGLLSVSILAIEGGLFDLGIGFILGLLSNLIVHWFQLVPQGLESSILSNFNQLLENPPASLDLLIPAWIFIIIFSIGVIPISFIKPGADDENVLLFAGVAVGIIAGLVFYFIFRDQPGPELIKSLTIFGSVIGFIGGLIPGLPY